MMTRRTVLQTGGWAAGLALLGTPLVSVATPIVEIQMRGNADGSAVWFDPVGVLIGLGQTVRWINTDRGNSHTSTAYHPKNTGHPLRIPGTAESWNSDYLLPDQAFEVRFTAAGVYDYFCIPHEEAGMVGRIIVGSPASAGLPSDNLPEAARQVLPKVEEIVQRQIVRIAL
jgi:plastocyanin